MSKRSQKNGHLSTNCNFGTIDADSSLHRFHSIAWGLCDQCAWGLHSDRIAGSIDRVQVFELLLHAIPWLIHSSMPCSSMPPIGFEECPCLAWCLITALDISKTPINLSHCIHSLELYITHLWDAIVRAIACSWIPIGFFSP